VKYKHIASISIPLLLAIIIALLLYYTYNPGTSESKNDYFSIPRDFVKAIEHLKNSVYSLTNASEGFSYMSIPMKDLEDLYTRLEEYSLGIDVGYGSLGNKLMEAARNYALCVNASKDIASTLPIVANTSKILREALRDLQLCRIDKALEEYSRVRESVEYIMDNLGKASINLISIDPKALLSNKHREVVNLSIDRVVDTLDMYRSIDRLFNIVESYRNLLKIACSGKGIDRGSGMNIINSLNSIQGSGELAWEIVNTKNTIVDMIKKSMLSNESSEAQGNGAGYVAPKSDD